MNRSFDSLRLVNTYGAFGSVTKQRTEVGGLLYNDPVKMNIDQVVLEGSQAMDPEDPKAVWEEYHFKCKPGALKKVGCDGRHS